MNPICQSISLENVLHDQCDANTESQIQEHLDSCVECQQRLETLAADEQTWTDTTKNLSTIEQYAVTKDLQRKLRDSSTFLIASKVFPKTSDGEQENDTSDLQAAKQSWTHILDPPKHPEMLGQIDHFEIESKIGQGGMGIVLKGFDRELDRTVAIKVLSPHLASNGTARKRFAREAQAAAAVVHPNVVPIYSVNQNVERPYIAMQLVSGRSLQSVVDEDGPLPLKSVVRIAIQIADGLSAAHEQGLIHRDVKPANVLTERDVRRVMITDFGLARAVDDVGMTQTGWLAGTPHYMSPEQAMGEDVDPRSDLFSLGSLLYFLSTGREPFRAQRSYGVIQKIVNERQISPNQVNAEVTSTLSSVIEKLLAKDPNQRFQSASELAEYLRDYLAHLQQPNVAKPPVKIDPPETKNDGSWSFLSTVIAFVGATALVLLCGAFLWGLFFVGFRGASNFPEFVGDPPSGVPQIPAETVVGPPAVFPSVEEELVLPDLPNDSLFQEIEETQRELGKLEEMFGLPLTTPSNSQNSLELPPPTTDKPKNTEQPLRSDDPSKQPNPIAPSLIFPSVTDTKKN